MKKPLLIVGNWKMNPTSQQIAVDIFSGIESGLQERNKKVATIIAPAYVHISALSNLFSKRKIKLAGQDVFYDIKGSHTGEVSIEMLQNAGAEYVIIGHSEKRAKGEGDESISKKVALALKFGLTPILCVGEKVRDDDGAYLSLIKEQIERGLAQVEKRKISSIVIAYEPVWAIGATEAMHPSDVHTMMIFIRKVLIDFTKSKNLRVPVLYGGAVDPLNAKNILTEGEAMGLLIGRQSLDPKSFLEIINIANAL